MGIILSFIAVFMIFMGMTYEYIIGALGVLLIFISVPIAFIGLILKSNKQQKVVSGRLCSKCGRKIPIDAVVCPYCQYVFTDALRHEY
jgi:ribosomal protein L40E